jgi:hypothetical protein
MSFLRRHLLAAAATIVVASSPAGAFAQTPVAAPTPQKHACAKPAEHPGRLATDNQVRAWTRSANAYLECLKKFITEQQAAAKPYQEGAKIHVEAGNAAIEEYNNSVKELKDQQDKAGVN